MLELFQANDDIKSIIMIGEIGSSVEDEAERFLVDEARMCRSKPVAGFIAGSTMGHAGSANSDGNCSAEDKIEAMRSAGIVVSGSPANPRQVMLKAVG